LPLHKFTFGQQHWHFPYIPHTQNAYSSIEYSGVVNYCNLGRRRIKDRSSQSVDFDNSKFQIVTKQSFLNRNIQDFFVHKAIFQQSQNKGTILFSENGSIYPKAV
jgi:hypothetical protein